MSPSVRMLLGYVYVNMHIIGRTLYFVILVAVVLIQISEKSWCRETYPDANTDLLTCDYINHDKSKAKNSDHYEIFLVNYGLCSGDYSHNTCLLLPEWSLPLT